MAMVNDICGEGLLTRGALHSVRTGCSRRTHRGTRMSHKPRGKHKFANCPCQGEREVSMAISLQRRNVIVGFCAFVGLAILQVASAEDEDLVHMVSGVVKHV